MVKRYLRAVGSLVGGFDLPFSRLPIAMAREKRGRGRARCGFSFLELGVEVNEAFGNPA